MLKKYLVKITDILISQGIPIGDIKKLEDVNIVRLVFKDQPELFFEIEVSEKSHHLFRATWSKFDKGFPRVVTSSSAMVSFDTVDNNLKLWADEIHKYDEENYLQDPWDNDDQVSNEPKLLSESLSSINFEEDELFIEEERVLLRKELAGANEYIKSEIGLDSDKLEKIENALKDLIKKVDELTKVNWKSEAKGILKDVIIDSAKDAISLAKLASLFGNLWEGGFTLVS